MTFRVRLLQKARQDVDAILDWMVNKRKAWQGAAAWFRAYEVALDDLVTAAEQHSLAPEDEHVDYKLQQFFFKTRRGRTYRGIYTIDGDEILILRIRGPGQANVEPDELR